MHVECIKPQDWAVLSEKAHLVCFGTQKPAHWDRIDFALMTIDETGTPMGYVTCREHDAETLYWQFGGAFPTTKGTIKSFRTYESLINYVRAMDYKRVTTLIENTNLVMLKMAMTVGFRIIGVRNYKDSILLEHLLELKGE